MVSITAAVAFLKGAIERGPVAGIMGCYFVREGMMYAHNEYVQAGVPFNSQDEQDFIVPATELEFTVGRMNGEPQISIVDQDVVIKSGRLRSSIPVVDGEPPVMANTDGDWLELPKGFCAALKQALQFAGEQGWSASVRLMDGHITAINNRCGVDIDMPDLEVGAAKMLAVRSVEFLCSVDEPVAYLCAETSMMFQWQDGRWARFQLLAYDMPAQVDELMKGAHGEVPVEITADWRAAYEDVAALSDGDVVLHPKGLEAKKGAAKVLVEIDAPEFAGRSRWTCKVLNPMLAVATHWSPNNHPKAAPFAGPGLRGLVMGVVQ